jgi:hypothetical protein
MAWALVRPVPVLAQDASGTVVELYTSQGCSSCPPADEYLSKLAQEPGVIALALHVDYWDYIGWKDDFASPGFTDRQRAYALAAGQNTIYTPQMIVGGVDHAVGSDPDMVAGMIRRHQSAEKLVVLQLMREGGKVVVRASARMRLEAPLVVQIVRFKPSARVEIERGENAGRAITYSNIVTAWDRVGEWDGSGELNLTLPAPGPDAVVVILQEAGPGMIRAAAMVQ